jgi:FkbH-like protein
MRSAWTGSQGAVVAVNRRLTEVAAATRNVYVLDYDHLVARRGADDFEDRRKWLTVRLPVRADELPSLAREWVRFLHPLTGRICKCLAVDLDNTLWGGVIGEDGMDGIKLDSGPHGFAWQSLQRALLDLHARGVILAIASKNNPAEATEAIEKHPGMLLRMHHFAAVRINWNDKATSLREIAAELNIGIDSIAFLDDNPVERAWVRGQLPDVTVIELPDDPIRYADAVREAPVFERLSLTEEDRSRGRMYAEQRMRTELQSSTTSLEDFYRSLDMVVEIAPVTAATLSRTAQLTQKTNQFNLTTRRYTEQQIADFAADPACKVYTMKVVDRMGDNGLVGVAITRDAGDVAEVDSFLMSCRVIGRTVETALLSHIAEEARGRGRQTLRGWYAPTKKNAPCKEFYSSHGFRREVTEGDATQWELDLAHARLSCPPWIDLRTSSGASGL